MIDRSQPAIEVYNLHRFFGRVRAVDDISFQVYPGQVFGFIGPNGAGKTTTMRILATLDQPSYGNAYVAGFSVVEDPDQVRLRLGFMPDYFNTYPYVNVVEYLDFYARAYGLRGNQRRRAVEFTMHFTGLEPLADKPTRALSKGMKQRLCLGRAMIHDPLVLVLDEPAAGLDPRARIELRQMIRRLAQRGKAVFISSHILTELAEICDAVGVIEAGKLRAQGPVEHIRRQLARGGATVQVELLDQVEQAVRWLEQRVGVSQVERGQQENTLTFQHEGDASERAELLRQMVQAGLPVVGFSAKEHTLEDLFLALTEGNVQ